MKLAKDDKEIAQKLQQLKTQLARAQEIKQDLEALTRTLAERYIASETYALKASLQANLAHLREIFCRSDDLKIREFWLVPFQLKAAVVYFEAMADQASISENVIEKLTESFTKELATVSGINLLEAIENIMLTSADVATETAMERIVNKLLTGDAVLFIDSINTAIVIAARKLATRSINEPAIETEIHGARDGFVEDLNINITLIRRRVKNPNLVVQKRSIGQRSRTEVAIVYFRGIANFRLVEEVEKRLQNISVDIPVPSALQSLLEDAPFSVFPTLMTTERPEKAAALLAEGRVIILIDGSPASYIAPTAFSDFFKSGDDYYNKWLPAALIRATRYIAAFFALCMPALYVAVTTYHPALLPMALTRTIATARTGVPIPAFVEGMLMEAFLEIMQEAGIRLPKVIGPAVSIVGGLVIGQAAVEAGLVSSTLVVVISFTAISTFCISDYRMGLPLRMLRVPLMMAAAALGMFGVICGLLIIATHLSILESFGEPYVAPLTPKSSKGLADLKDTIGVLPAKAMTKRPSFLEPLDKQRQKSEE